MRKLFLVALAVGVCTPAIMAQETVKAGIYGGIQNLRFNAPATSKQDAKQGSAKAGIYGGLQNLHFNASETSKQDVKDLPLAPKSTFFSAIPPETGKQYANNLPFNSPGAGGLFQCPPSCPSDDYNRVEIYAGFSLLRYDARLLNLVGLDISDFDGLIDGSDFFDNNDLRLRRDLIGGDFSFTYNFTRYIGAQADFSFHRRHVDDFNLVFFDPTPPGLIVFGDVDRTRFRVSNFLFGVQVKDNLEDGYRLRPFGNFLVGFSRQRLRLNGLTFNGDFDADGDLDIITFDDGLFDDDDRFRRNSFALAIGGGIDVRITDRFSIRALKFDYLPVFARRHVVFLDFTPPIDFFFVDADFDKKVQHNFRVGAGLVFHF